MALRATFPEDGDGALAAIDELMRASDGALRASRPRFFHWVGGGTTPSALAAGWLPAACDQLAFAYDSTPLGVRCEELAIDWLKELFGLPASWGGVLTTGATMANFTALVAARRRQRAGARGSARGARLLERLHPPQRDEGARDGRHRPRYRPSLRARRCRPRRPRGPRGGAAVAGRRARDYRRERPRGQRRGLRSHRTPGRSRGALRIVAARRRRLRSVRPRRAARGASRRRRRACALGHRRRAQVAERRVRLRPRVRA